MNNLLNPQKYRQVNPFNMFNLWFFIYIRNFSYKTTEFTDLTDLGYTRNQQIR